MVAGWGVGSCRVVLSFTPATLSLPSQSWRRRLGRWLAGAGAHGGAGAAAGRELLQELTRRERACFYAEGREREGLLLGERQGVGVVYLGGRCCCRQRWGSRWVVDLCSPRSSVCLLLCRALFKISTGRPLFEITQSMVVL